MERQSVAVFRDSSTAKTIDSTNLVVGDIYEVKDGMKIPADSILLESRNGVDCNESLLTGETEPQ